MTDSAEVFGVDLPEARRRIGSLAQIARIDEFVETQGSARGARRLRVVTGGGLSFDVHPDRALDLGHVTFRETPLSWISPVGIGAPGHTHDVGTDWLRTFGGGMLTTCGLDSFGPASTHDGVDYPMHGRISSVPATVTRVQVGDDSLIIEGEVRQAAVFGENLVLRRRIEAPLGGSSIRIFDTVTNEGARQTGHMVLYHCNLGWPLLSEHAVLRIPSAAVTPRDAAAESGVASWHEISAPVRGYAEQVFRHDFREQGVAEVSVDNPERDVRLAIRFDTATLPGLHQWKMLGEGHYVLGLEPVNVDWSRGRAAADAEGVLPELMPGESVSYAVEMHAGPSRVRGSKRKETA
ncbi:aldose 1-epimerase family protein [Microbacterium sp. zg-Y818]|uniref:aldose 1-epimerase family protein n=1 Tax=unclassified Microbacterium TaxID=2609290 RepID=UPI00214CD9D1|nr:MULTISPECIES: aldose 1-epimerase family protein [unclassified Microbacterium]MCR2800133.1 aldose 1-epimerase family protein [Microbacterium sp. zg.Y818]WIM22104.1 aldose 1-epimerase family protein [Microbacterium sp. zg-Y818]